MIRRHADLAWRHADLAWRHSYAIGRLVTERAGRARRLRRRLHPRSLSPSPKDRGFSS